VQDTLIRLQREQKKWIFKLYNYTQLYS
jgi:hypothetical protein